MIGTMSLIAFKRTLAAALALVLLAGVGLPAQAAGERWLRDPDGSHGFAPYRVAERRVTLAQAIEAVQRATGGQSAGRQGPGRPVPHQGAHPQR